MHRLDAALARTVPFLVALAVAVVAVAVAVPTGAVLVVEDVDTGERYLATTVENGTVVGLAYTHSVEKTPVYDEYRIEGTTLVNTRMEFASYGWGLPARVDVTTVDGRFVYDPPTPIAELDSLSVSPGRIAGHTLVVGDRRYDLVALTDASDVRIRVERRPPIALLT